MRYPSWQLDILRKFLLCFHNSDDLIFVLPTDRRVRMCAIRHLHSLSHQLSFQIINDPFPRLHIPLHALSDLAMLPHLMLPLDIIFNNQYLLY